MSLLEAIQYQLVNTETGEFKDPRNPAEKGDLRKAVDGGLLDPKSAEFIRPGTGQRFDLKQALDNAASGTDRDTSQTRRTG